MDHAVEHYLRSQAALFLSADCTLAITEDGAPSRIEMVAVDFNNKTVWLCASGADVMKTLRLWQSQWPLVQMALWRDHKIPLGFEIHPWAFVSQDQKLAFDAAFTYSELEGQMPSPRFTKLEDLAALLRLNRRRDDINGLQFAA